MIKDIVSEPTGPEELLRIGGKLQVPFLVDARNGLSLYESDDIIDHLKRYYAHQSARISE
jgi:glutathione S-transferase